jgi:hypothetical protein
MKYIKKFNEQEKSTHDWCREFKITKYKITEDGLVNVNNSVDISHRSLDQIPIDFGVVKYNFNCSENFLTDLYKCPIEVGNVFDCQNNMLTWLRYGPNITGDFICCGNLLQSLSYGPEEVNGDFNCANNRLKSLKGYPEKVTGFFNCGGNPIYRIYDKIYDRMDRYKEYINIFDTNICDIFPDVETYIESLDINYHRENNKIVKRRFEKACKDAGVRMPESIPGYKYID